MDTARKLRGSTGRLLMTVRALNEHDTPGPSLCRGWSRGHVLAHVALNADSLVNLMRWARTGVETPQYASWEVRDGDIESASGRTLGEHLAALTESAARFEHAAESLPPERWSSIVAGIGGDPQPVSNYLMGRRREIEVHHVDLDAGYEARHWPTEFVESKLGHAAEKLSRRAVGGFEIVATDLRISYRIGAGDAAGSVQGPGHRILRGYTAVRTTATSQRRSARCRPSLHGANRRKPATMEGVRSWRAT